jgi:phage terminase small subunit
MSDKLTARERAFAHAYINCFDMAKAAVEAKFSPRTARQQGYRTYHKPHVKAYIETLLDEIMENKKETAVKLRQELENIAFSNFADVADLLRSGMTKEDFAKLSESVQRTIAEATIEDTKFGENHKVKLHSKLSAIDSLIKLLELTKERVEHSGEVITSTRIIIGGQDFDDGSAT